MGGRTILAGALAALVLGCGSGGGGSDPDSDAGPDDADAGSEVSTVDCARKSGSRIRQVERSHSDGSDELLRLYDNQLMVPCSFGLADDGSLRCLPVADGAPFASGQIWYKDVDCTMRIARLDDPLGPDAPDYVRQSYTSNDGCEVRTRFAALGNQFVPPGESVYDGDCLPVAPGTNPYFDVTDDFAPTELVEGTASWTDSGRVKLQQIDGADGSRVCGAGMIDEDLDSHPCALRTAEDGAVRCLPTSTGLEAAFANDVCDEAVNYALLDATCGAPDRYTYELTGGACPKTRVRALIEELDAVYIDGGDTCDALAIEEDQTLFREGPAVSGTSFSEFKPAYSSPGDRLERVDFDNGEGLRFATVSWRDPNLDDAWCAFQVAEDGLERCLPYDSDDSPVANVSAGVFYSDGGCVTEVEVGELNLTCGRAMPKYAVENVDGEILVRESMGAWEAGTLFENPGACQAVADPTIYSHLGPVMPAAMFVSGTEMIE